MPAQSLIHRVTLSHMSHLSVGCSQSFEQSKQRTSLGLSLSHIPCPTSCYSVDWNVPPSSKESGVERLVPSVAGFRGGALGSDQT